jgi:integrase
MEALQFKIQLKAGKTKTASALLLAYNKAFTGHRFIMSTGIEVKRTGFDVARPGKALKDFIAIAEKASEDLRTEGIPLNNATLKQRIELMAKKFVLSGSQLSVWFNNKATAYTIPDGIDTKALTKAIEGELTKVKPDLHRVVASHFTQGANELFGFWEAVVDGKVKTKSGEKLRPISAINKRQTLKIVKAYNPNLTFADMDVKFYNNFRTYLEGEGYEPNSIGKHFKELKSILHRAKANGYNINEGFIGWAVTREQNEVVALSKEEVLAIANLEITGSKKDVRDIFVMACFLGLRIGDFPKLKKENFVVRNGLEFFDYVQEKTGASVSVPVLPQLQQIISAWSAWPKMISEQNFRSQLKSICKLAGLNDRVVIRIREGKPEYKIKWEAISPHSARRTFASALFYGWWANPLTAAYTMQYTGHESEKTFMLYIGASKKDKEAKAVEMLGLKPQMKIA